MQAQQQAEAAQQQAASLAQQQQAEAAQQHERATFTLPAITMEPVPAQAAQEQAQVQVAVTPAADVGGSMAAIGGDCVAEEKRVPEVLCDDMPDISKSVLPRSTADSPCSTALARF